MTKIDFSTKRVDLIIILLSAFLMLVVLNFPFKANPLGDYTFHEESKNLALFLKGDVPLDKVVITKAPGPILFYTPAYLFAPADATDDQLWVYGVVLTSIIMTISLLLIFRICARFFSKEVGLLCVLLFFIFPIHSYYSLGILAEVPAFFSLSLAIYGWSIAFKEPNLKKGWIMLTLGMWLFILNRPNAMLLLGLLAVVIAYSFLKNKVFFKTYGKKLVFTFLSVLFLGMGVLELAKKLTASHSTVNQESYFYYVAHIGRFQFRDEPTDFRFWDNDNRPDSKDYQHWIQSAQELATIEEVTKRPSNEIYRQFLIEDVLDHPLVFTRQFFVKCLFGNINIVGKMQPDQFHLGPFKGTTGYWIFHLIINSINLIIILGAALFLFKQKNLLHYWIFWGAPLALLVFHGITYMEPRYIFPSRVALYCMGAVGLYRIGFIKKVIDKLSVYIFPIANSK